MPPVESWIVQRPDGTLCGGNHWTARSAKCRLKAELRLIERNRRLARDLETGGHRGLMDYEDDLDREKWEPDLSVVEWIGHDGKPMPEPKP